MDQPSRDHKKDLPNAGPSAYLDTDVCLLYSFDSSARASSISLPLRQCKTSRGTPDQTPNYIGKTYKTVVLTSVFSRFVGAEKWRKDTKLDELLPTWEYPEKEAIFKYYPQYYHKTDKVLTLLPIMAQLRYYLGCKG